MYRTFTIFKGCSAQELYEQLEIRMFECKGSVKWDSDDRNGLLVGICSTDDMHTINVCYVGGTYGFFKEIGKRLDCPWMEARIQDGNHWDYSLMQGGRELDDFSTFPQYYHRSSSKRNEYKGNPQLLADTWGIPIKRIERYLVNWGDAGQRFAESPFPFLKTVMVNSISGAVNIVSGRLKQNFKRKGKAYPTDEFEYGDCWQVLDFINALAGSTVTIDAAEDNMGERHHRLFFPDDDYFFTSSPRLQL